MMLCPRQRRRIISLCLLLTTLTTAFNLDCSDIRDDNQSWNLQDLGGPHSVKSIKSFPPVKVETTFTIDICRPLQVPKKVNKGEYCPNGTRVCGFQRTFNSIENVTIVSRAIPIAGEYGTSTGEPLNPRATRLKTSTSPSDRQKEGVRLLLHGAKYPPNKEGKRQQAVVDFLCDRKEQDRRRGILGITEREEDGEDGGDGGDGSGDGGEDSNPADGRETDDGHGGKLKFLSYDDMEGVQVLSLEWTTKYACEDSSSGGSGASSGHWGFFTWLIIIVFLGTATYLIFGSWLNYTRHGVRGFDAVPHSEAIRDLPYLLRDWSRKIVNTVSGGGSRGGYSAV